MGASFAQVARWRRRRHLAGRGRVGSHSQREIRAAQVDWIRRAWWVIALLGVPVGVGAVAAHWLMPQPAAPYVVGAVVACGPWLGYVLWLQTGDVASLRAGVEGEGYTVDELRRLQRQGWRLVNHVMLRHRDVDHALVGPGGLYAIETKYRSRWKCVRDADFDAWAAQARQDAVGLTHRAGQRVPAVPIIAVWGPGVRALLPIPLERNGVTICVGRDLVDVIERSRLRLTAGDIEFVYDKLDTYVRTRTIGEEREHGPLPRPVLDSLFDLFFGVLAGFATMYLVAVVVRIGPPAASWSASCTVLGASSWMIRRRWSSARRPTAIATGVFAASVLLLVAVGCVALLRAIVG